MDWDAEINEWNNPIIEMSIDYWQNGCFTEFSGKYMAVFTAEQIMEISALILLGKEKVVALNNGGKEV